MNNSACPFPCRSISGLKPYESIPYEKRLFANVNGGKPYSVPRWEATGEYHENSVFNPVSNTWEDENKKVVVEDTGFVLVKGSSFVNSQNNTETTLYEDVSLKVHGLLKCNFGPSFVEIGEGKENKLTVTSPIILVNGFGVQTTGLYTVELNDKSKIRVSVGKKVRLLGVDDNQKVTLTLDEVMNLSFNSVVVLPDVKIVESSVKETKTEPKLVSEFVPSDLLPTELKKTELFSNDIRATPTLSTTIYSAPPHEKVILTKELLAKLTK